MGIQFLGFKQVLKSTFDSESAKTGYLWFVRENSGSTYGDIYFGSRHYGHFGSEAEDIQTINTILSDAGIVDESGNTVDIASLIEASQLEAGIAIDISGKTINTKVADETENAIDEKNANKNFLKVNDENELEVLGVDSDSTVLSKDITIEGGEWATAVKKAYTGGTVPSGTTLQEFLTAMLCVEKWGNAYGPTYTFSASITKPSITMSTTAVPVGTKISPSATIGTSSSSLTAKVSGLTYGYSTNGTSKASTSTTYTQTKNATTGGSTTLTTTYTNFVELSDGNFVSATSSDGTAKEVYVKLGTNTYTANETGLTYTPTSFDEVTIYAVSNLGNIKDTGVTVTSDGVGTSAKTPTNTGSASITGYYPIYYGTINTTNATEDNVKDAISGFANTNSTVPSQVTTNAGTGAFIMAVPSNNANYSKSSITLLDSKDMSFGASHTFTSDIAMLNNVETVNYRFFYITNANATTSQSTWNVSFS